MKKTHRILVALSILAISGVAACGTLKGLTVCVSDPAKGGLQCSKDGAEKYFLPYSESENFIALPPKDAEKVFQECTDRKGD